MCGGEIPDQIPVLHVRGTHYEVGLSIGRTFRGLIQDFMDANEDFHTETLPIFESEEGRAIYEDSLRTVQARFPQYMAELEGMAEGAKLPFEHLFLLHVENLLFPYDDREGKEEKGSAEKCTSIITNTENAILLGHTEDAVKEMRDCFFLVVAQVLNEEGEELENFAALTYPGYLPGGTMGYNKHGFIHSINSIFPRETFPQRSNYLFLLRGILSARNQKDLLRILEDDGCGTNDGFSLNVIWLLPQGGVEAYNVEVAPNQDGGAKSLLDLWTVDRGTSYAHCNKYLRCQVPQKVWQGSSSDQRHETLAKFQEPYDLTTVKDILSTECFECDGRSSRHSIYKSAPTDQDAYASIAVGIFDILRGKWDVYRGPPTGAPPLVSLSLPFMPGDLEAENEPSMCQ